jgi:phage tail-like protein
MSVFAYYPPPAFYFTVTVAGSGTALQLSSMADASFQEASGIEAKMELQAVPEGGQNGYVHQLPTVTKYPNLVLRRGYVTRPSFLSEWTAQTVGSNLSQPILTQNLVVMLLSSAQPPLEAVPVPLAAWNFANAWPVRWATGPFDSTKNDVLTEVLEFSYATVSRIPGPEAAVMVPAVSKLIRS